MRTASSMLVTCTETGYKVKGMSHITVIIEISPMCLLQRNTLIKYISPNPMKTTFFKPLRA